MFTMEFKDRSVAENISFEVLEGIGPVVLAEVRIGNSYAVASKLLSRENYDVAVAAALDEARNRLQLTPELKLPDAPSEEPAEFKQPAKPRRRRKSTAEEKQPEAQAEELTSAVEIEEEPVEETLRSVSEEPTTEDLDTDGTEATDEAYDDLLSSDIEEVQPCVPKKSNDAEMTLEDALKVVFPAGGHKGKTVEEILKTDPHGLEFYSKKGNNETYKEVAAAAKVVLSAQA